MWEYFTSQIIICIPVCYRPSVKALAKLKSKLVCHSALSTTLLVYHHSSVFSSSLILQILQITGSLFACIRPTEPYMSHAQEVRHHS